MDKPRAHAVGRHSASAVGIHAVRRGASRMLSLLVACSALTFTGAIRADWPGPSARFLERFQQLSIIHAQEAMARSSELAACLEELLSKANAEHLARCRSNWLSSHRGYLKARVFDRVAAHSHRTPVTSTATDLLVDGWPIQEGYVDSLEEYPSSGIVNDLTVTISEESLLKQNGLTDPTEVALGFHPLEFILWSKGPEDFMALPAPTEAQREAGLTAAELPNNRRREMARLLAQLLDRQIWRQFEPLAEEQRLRRASPYQTATALSTASTEGWRHLSREVDNYLSSDPQAKHSRFSRSSVQDLSSEAEVLASIIDLPGNFILELEPLDPELARRYLVHLREVVALIRALDSTEQELQGAARLESTLRTLIEESQRFDQHLRIERP